jgi:ribosome maturation factor RimP
MRPGPASAPEIPLDSAAHEPIVSLRPSRRSPWGHSFSKEALSILPLKESLEARTEPALAGLGYTLLEVEVAGPHGRPILRFFIDSPDGVTLDDCARASRELGDLIEAEDLVPGSYVLEVSSPGATRALKREKDYQHFLGRRVRVAFRERRDGPAEVSGQIVAFEEGLVHLETADGRIVFPVSAVGRAQLEL